MSYTMQQLQAIAAVAYAAACVQGGVQAANLGAGSQLGPVINATSQQGALIQGQVDDATANSRLLTIPQNADGTPNPAVDTFIDVFSCDRLDGDAATTTVAIGVNSPVTTPMVIPVGMIVMRQSDNVQYVVTADATQTAYSATAGGNPNGGYVIPGDDITTNVSCTVTCMQVGTIGNCPIGAINAVFSGPGNPAPQGIIVYGNGTAVTNGISSETDPAYISRFQIQQGVPKYGVRAAILSAVAGVSAGIIYQYANVMNASGEYQAAYFTVVVNMANSGAGPSPSLISAVDSAIDAVRAGGAEYAVIGPTLRPVTVTGAITVQAGQVASTVLQTAVSAVNAYINGIGMNPDASNTTCSWSQIVAILNGVSGIASVASVQINAGTTDLTAGFAQQFVAAATQGLTA
jgi:hypothetical protein